MPRIGFLHTKAVGNEALSDRTVDRKYQWDPIIVTDQYINRHDGRRAKPGEKIAIPIYYRDKAFYAPMPDTWRLDGGYRIQGKTEDEVREALVELRFKLLIAKASVQGDPQRLAIKCGELYGAPTFEYKRVWLIQIGDKKELVIREGDRYETIGRRFHYAKSWRILEYSPELEAKLAMVAEFFAYLTEKLKALDDSTPEEMHAFFDSINTSQLLLTE